MGPRLPCVPSVPPEGRKSKGTIFYQNFCCFCRFCGFPVKNSPLFPFFSHALSLCPFGGKWGKIGEKKGRNGENRPKKRALFLPRADRPFSPGKFSRPARRKNPPSQGNSVPRFSPHPPPAAAAPAPKPHRFRASHSRRPPHRPGKTGRKIPPTEGQRAPTPGYNGGKSAKSKENRAKTGASEENRGGTEAGTAGGSRGRGISPTEGWRCPRLSGENGGNRENGREAGKIPAVSPGMGEKGGIDRPSSRRYT